MDVEPRTLKYYEARRAEIISLLEVPYLPADYRDMLEKARDFATDRILQLQNIADMGGVTVHRARDRRSGEALRTQKNQKRRNHAKHEFFKDNRTSTQQD